MTEDEEAIRLAKEFEISIEDADDYSDMVDGMDAMMEGEFYSLEEVEDELDDE